MYHPLLLQPEVLCELPALLEDRRPRVVEVASFSYRSEAFAEDLGADAPSPVVRPGRTVAALLCAAPIAAALAGGLLATFFGSLA